MARVIVVTSGKGGVGKSSVCVNVASHLANSGYRVCLIDADLGLKNLDVMLGLESRVVFDIQDVSDYCVSGLSNELVCINIYNAFIRNNKGILVVTSSTFEANNLYSKVEGTINQLYIKVLPTSSINREARRVGSKLERAPSDDGALFILELSVFK